MTAKHTPGPWTANFEHHARANDAQFMVCRDDNHPLAVLSADGWIGISERKASARQQSADSYHKHSSKGRNMTDKQPAALADHTERHLDMVGRWYMVNKMGMATLCSDKAGAEEEAADAQRFWPHMGPHRAVQLAPAGDMAKLRGQRMVLCSLLRECMPVIDALMQMPGDDDSDAHLNGLAGRITGALNALAEDQVKGGES